TTTVDEEDGYSQDTQSQGSQSALDLSQPSEADTCMSSQYSDATVVNISRLESLNAFLTLCDVSPVKKLNNPLSKSSERTKKRYMDKAQQCFTAMIETIAPNEADVIWNSIINYQAERCAQPSEDSNMLKNIYLNAENWQFRRQVLSIIVERMFLEEAKK
ncbi:hypothetical protein MHBO_004971, partial [Bonamia ostreae]